MNGLKRSNVASFAVNLPRLNIRADPWGLPEEGWAVRDRRRVTSGRWSRVVLLSSPGASP